MAFVPRAETQATDFLAKYPEFDGRNVLVAIVDSGADASVPTLQITSDGKHKIVDQISLSGAGDVRLLPSRNPPKVDEKSGNLILESMDGRFLVLNKEWKNPTGVWRVACRQYKSLLPKNHDIQTRLLEREKKKLDEEVEKIRAGIKIKLQDKQDEDLAKQLEALAHVTNLIDLSAASVQIVSWHDGQNFRAVLGLEDDLSNQTPMTNFRTERQVAFFDRRDCVSYTINFYDDGNVISIFVSEGHGSHCAGICLGFSPTNALLNGVAPGAQFINIQISDFKVGTLESQLSMDRLAKVIVDNKVDILSLSFGEADYGDAGRFARALDNLILNHNVIFVVASGNEGPTYQVTAQPEPFSAPYFDVAALITPEISMAGYGKLSESPLKESMEKVFNFSTRGPSMSDGFGPNICAPGSAHAAVPAFDLVPFDLKHGTSMACPNVSGCLALVLSGLKAKKIAYSPWTIVSIAQQTSKWIPGYNWVDIGFGMIQVLDLFESFCKLLPSRPCYLYGETVDGQRGISIRDQHVVDVVEMGFSPKLKFPDNSPSQQKIDFSTVVSVESNQSWITHSNNVVVTNDSFAPIFVKVDARKLGPGSHFGKVVVFGASREEGPLFCIPVSVVIPDVCSTNVWTGPLVGLAQQNPPSRHFVRVPLWATHMLLSIESAEEVPPMKFVIRAKVNARVPGKRDANNLIDEYVAFSRKQIVLTTQRCFADSVLELSMTTGECDRNAFSVIPKITFFSYALQSAFSPNHIETTILSDFTPHLIAFSNLSRVTQKSEIAPSASFSTLLRTFRPSVPPTLRVSKDERDRILTSAVPWSELELTYSFDVDEDSEIGCTTSFSEFSYAYAIGAELKLFSASHQHLRTFDWGGASIFQNEDRFFTALKKGSFYVKCILRHEDGSLLDKYKNVALQLWRKLKKPVSLSCSNSMLKCFATDFAPAKMTLKPNESIEMWFAAAAELPAKTLVGDVLIGFLTVGGISNSEKFKYPISYHVQSVNRPPKVQKNVFSAKSAEFALANSLLVATTAHFAEIKSPFSTWHHLGAEKAAEFSRFGGDLDAAELTNLRLTLLRAAAADPLFDAAKTSQMANEIISSLSESDIALHFGVPNCEDGSRRAAYEQKKAHLIEALKLRFSADPSAENLRALKRWSSSEFDSGNTPANRLLQVKTPNSRQDLLRAAEAANQLGWNDLEVRLRRTAALWYPQTK